MTDAEIIAICRAAFHEIGKIDVPAGGDAASGLKRAQLIAAAAAKLLSGIEIEAKPAAKRKPNLKIVTPEDE